MTPPRKRAGRASGPRTLAGEVLDVREASRLLGFTERMTRARIARRELPHRRLGRDGTGRVVLLRSELVAWLDSLPGVRLEEVTSR